MDSVKCFFLYVILNNQLLIYVFSKGYSIPCRMFLKLSNRHKWLLAIREDYYGEFTWKNQIFLSIILEMTLGREGLT